MYYGYDTVVLLSNAENQRFNYYYRLDSAHLALVALFALEERIIA